jgi:hypothetical protein
VDMRLSAHARGTPRKWPENCLAIEGREVLLWDAAIDEPCFTLPLRFWHSWRERLARPDQWRLYRKSLQWSQSRLLFPGPNGAPISRAALHNALRPCACNRLRRKRTSPLRCCRRLILRLSYPARMGCCFCTRSDGRKTQANTRPFGNRGQNPALDRPKIGGLNAVRTDLNCQSRAEARAIRRLATTSPSCLPRSHASSNSSSMTS